MTSPIEFTYFDLGNVLISFDHSRAFHQISRLTGVTPGRVEQILFDEELQACYETGAVSTREFHTFFCEQAQADISLEDLCFSASNIFEPLTDSIRLLQRLKKAGHRLGLLSNTCDCHWRFCTNDTRFEFLHSVFEQTVLSFKAGLAKPGRDIYRVAATKARCDPGSILFIDDLYANVSAARSYGFDGIHFVDVPQLKNELTKRGLIP